MTVLLAVICIVLLGLIWYEKVKRRAMQAILDVSQVDEDRAVTKHEQIAVLKSLGITLDPADEEALLWHSDPEVSLFYAHAPYWGLLGSEELRWNRVYSPGDAECIWDEDAYVPVFQGLFRIAGLVPEGLRGTDPQGVTFTLAGTPVTFRAKEQNDWIDLRVGGFLNRQVERLLPGTEERFWLEERHGVPIWLWATAEQAAAVNQKTGLSFKKT